MSNSKSLPPLPAGLQAKLSEIRDMHLASDAKIALLKDLMIKECLDYKYAYYMRMHPKMMGVHPTNRGGEGLTWHRAHSRLELIHKAGFSLPAIKENAVGIEDHPIDRHIEKFTLENCALSEHYARYEAGQIKGGTLGAGHANHGFACLHDRVPCTVESISEGGYMSQEKCFVDEGIRKSTTQGLEFLMFRWEIEAHFPELMDMVQSALNATSQAAEGEKWPQLLLKIVDEAKTVPDTKDKWEAVRKSVLKSNPPRPGDVKGMVDFVRYWGGLPNGAYVKTLKTLTQKFVAEERIVSGQFFQDVANLKFPANERPSMFITAAVFVHVKENKGVEDGISRFVTKGNVDSFATKNKALVLQADSILKRCSTLLDQLSNQKKNQLLGDLLNASLSAAIGLVISEDAPAVAGNAAHVRSIGSR